jgi:hypothetical protein
VADRCTPVSVDFDIPIYTGSAELSGFVVELNIWPDGAADESGNPIPRWTTMAVLIDPDIQRATRLMDIASVRRDGPAPEVTHVVAAVLVQEGVGAVLLGHAVDHHQN